MSSLDALAPLITAPWRDCPWANSACTAVARIKSRCTQGTEIFSYRVDEFRISESFGDMFRHRRHGPGSDRFHRLLVPLGRMSRVVIPALR